MKETAGREPLRFFIAAGPSQGNKVPSWGAQPHGVGVRGRLLSRRLTYLPAVPSAP